MDAVFVNIPYVANCNLFTHMQNAHLSAMTGICSILIQMFVQSVLIVFSVLQIDKKLHWRINSYF